MTTYARAPSAATAIACGAGALDHVIWVIRSASNHVTESSLWFVTNRPPPASATTPYGSAPTASLSTAAHDIERRDGAFVLQATNSVAPSSERETGPARGSKPAL